MGEISFFVQRVVCSGSASREANEVAWERRRRRGNKLKNVNETTGRLDNGLDDGRLKTGTQGMEDQKTTALLRCTSHL
jgi:hypothetical protein